MKMRMAIALIAPPRRPARFPSQEKFPNVRKPSFSELSQLETGYFLKIKEVMTPPLHVCEHVARGQVSLSAIASLGCICKTLSEC